MRKTIYKYNLPIDGGEIPMHAGATILSVQAQYNSIAMWATVDPQQKAFEIRHFACIHTGDNYTADNLKFLGTVLTDVGSYVTHVFERL